MVEDRRGSGASAYCGDRFARILIIRLLFALALGVVFGPAAGESGTVLPDTWDQLRILELPAIDEKQGPRLAVRWSGALPAMLQPGHYDGNGQWQARGEPTELIDSMTLLSPPTDAQASVFRLSDKDGRLLASARPQSETFGWEPTFVGPGIDGIVYAAIVYEGSLVIGGNFRNAGDQIVNRIARWTGEKWSSLGPDDIGMNHRVRSLTVHDGDLIAGGNFTEAGGQEVNHIARWDGENWSGMSGPNGTGMDGSVSALTVHEGDLIAGGHFAQAGGQEAKGIARWDGDNWSGLSGSNGSGIEMNGSVHALTIHGRYLVAGGFFPQTGDDTVFIARWDGEKWSGLEGADGTGTNGQVRALAVHEGDLFAGGDFTQAGGHQVNHIARWDGTHWSGLNGPDGTGTNTAIRTLAVHDGDLFAGGTFTLAGGHQVDHIARWDGEGWSGLSGPESTKIPSTPSIHALAVHDENLIAGGRFTKVSGKTINHIARWNGENWAALSGPDAAGMNNIVYSLNTYQGELIAGGLFLHAGDQKVNHIARWDGENWSGLSGLDSTGMSSSVYALAIYKGDLIVGGTFSLAGGELVNGIARWDGENWSGLSGPDGTGMSGAVLALAVHEGDLIVGGTFTVAGGQESNRIARWDGENWASMSGPEGAHGWIVVRALEVYDGDLIAAGLFNEIDGQEVNHIARWDGNSWSGLSGPDGIGVSASPLEGVEDLAVYRGDLIVAGLFIQAGGQQVHNIARWDGEIWSGLSGPNGTGMQGRVYTLAIYGNDLIAAGGYFPQAGGHEVNNIARWDGENWSDLSGPNGTGIEPWVRTLTVHNGDLVAGGDLTRAGGLPAQMIGRWRREATITEILLKDPGQIDPEEPVLVEARSEGPVSAPDLGNRGRIMADSGEFCDAEVLPAVDNQVTFSCHITLTTAGIRSITAHYTGSSHYEPSQSVGVIIGVNGLLHDRFEAQ